MERGAESAPVQEVRSCVHFGFENSYARLPERFYARLDPTPVAAPRLVKLNVELARELRLDPEALATTEGVEILAGNRIAEGSEPLAMAYAGHQFGHSGRATVGTKRVTDRAERREKNLRAPTAVGATIFVDRHRPQILDGERHTDWSIFLRPSRKGC